MLHGSVINTFKMEDGNILSPVTMSIFATIFTGEDVIMMLRYGGLRRLNSLYCAVLTGNNLQE